MAPSDVQRKRTAMPCGGGVGVFPADGGQRARPPLNLGRVRAGLFRRYWQLPKRNVKAPPSPSRPGSAACWMPCITPRKFHGSWTDFASAEVAGLFNGCMDLLRAVLSSVLTLLHQNSEGNMGPHSGSFSVSFPLPGFWTKMKLTLKNGMDNFNLNFLREFQS